MLKTSIKSWGVALGGVLLAAMSGQVLAIDGVQTMFYYNAYGGFVLNSQSASVPPEVHYLDENDWYINNAPVPESGYYMQLAWGSGDSNLQLLEQHSSPAVPDSTIWKQTLLQNDGEHLSGSVAVNDSFGSLMGYLTHFNNVISTSFEGTVDIHWHLDIYADEAKTIPVWYSPEATFQLQILETENYPSNLTCPAGVQPCPDRFQYRILPGGTFGDTIDLPMGGFDYNGVPYLVAGSGFYDEAGNLSGEFWSAEGGHNHAFVNFAVQAVPEPSPLLALCIGIPIVGYAVGRQRRRSSSAA